MVLSAWIFCSYIIVVGYSGNLRAFLLSPPLDNTIETMEDVEAR